MWRPALYAALRLRFDEGRDWAAERDDHRLFFPLGSATLLGTPQLTDADFALDTPTGLFAPLPAEADEASELRQLERDVKDDVLRGETEVMFRHRRLKLVSRAGEELGAFRDRVREAIGERIDAREAKLGTQVQRKLDRLEDKRERLERDIDRLEADVKAKLATEVVNAGETILGWFTGSRRKSLSTAMSKRESTRRLQERSSAKQDELRSVERDIYDLGVETEDAINAIENEENRLITDVETLDIGLERDDIRLTDFSIVWIPVSRLA